MTTPSRSQPRFRPDSGCHAGVRQYRSAATPATARMQLAKVQVQVQVQLASSSIQHPGRPQWGTTLATPQDFSMGHQIWKRAPPFLLSAPQISFREHVEAALFSRFAGL